MSNRRISPQPSNAMEAAWFKAVQKHATSKNTPAKPTPNPTTEPAPKPNVLGEFEGGLLPDVFGSHRDLL